MEDLLQLSCFIVITVYWIGRMYCIEQAASLEFSSLGHEDISTPNTEYCVMPGKTGSELDAVSNKIFNYLLCKKTMFNMLGENRGIWWTEDEIEEKENKSYLLVKACSVFLFSTQENYKLKISWKTNGAIWLNSS